jgi:hypothetical protein
MDACIKLSAFNRNSADRAALCCVLLAAHLPTASLPCLCRGVAGTMQETSSRSPQAATLPLSSVSTTAATTAASGSAGGPARPQAPLCCSPRPLHPSSTTSSSQAAKQQTCVGLQTWMAPAVWMAAPATAAAAAALTALCAACRTAAGRRQAWSLQETRRPASRTPCTVMGRCGCTGG